jgi:pyruvate/2-oxoglutarate dehydrogenase complex dihydrolipoamide dehydrogenase (E3) component
LGGTCVNNGCTPTKAYVASARRIWDIFHGEEMESKIQLAQKQILKNKSKKRYFSKWFP